MDGVVVFCGVLAGEGEDDFGAAWVFGEEVGYVVDFAVEDYPAAVLCAVLCDCGGRLARGRAQASTWRRFTFCRVKDFGHCACESICLRLCVVECI